MGGELLNRQACIVGIVAIALAGTALGQTFEVGGQKDPQSKQSGSNAQQAPNLGWGSGIEVARQVRAAQDALKQNDYATALSHAEQATKVAPNDAEVWFLLGYCNRLAGHYQASLDAFQRGLTHKQGSVRGMAGMAQTYVKMGRDEEAKQILLKVVQENPKDPDSLGLIGELFLDSDANRALDFLRRADGQKPSAHFELLIARAYQRLNQPEQAKQYLNRAKSRDPRNPDILRAVAGEYRESGDYKQAISTLQSISTKTPDILAELAYTYEVDGQKQEAAETYSKAVKGSKGNIGYILSAAQAYVGLGQLDTSRDYLEQAKAINPNHYRLHTIQAEIAVVEDRLPDAIQEYQTALTNLPQVPVEGPLYPIQLRLSLYELNTQNNNPAEAKNQLDIAGRELSQLRVPTAQRPEFLRMRAVVESQSGDLQAADRDLKEAMALAPGNINSMLNYGTLMWKFGQKDAARQMFLKVLETDHDNRAALTSLGFLSRELGSTQDAEQYFLRVAKLYPKDSGSQVALGDLYSSERIFDKAETAYANAYKRNKTNPLIISGGTNAALESHNLELAKTWLDR
ncbi:MAG TPA: tetratricopeptide repeat protein, partial [Terriglobales bacterium]